MSKPSSSSSSRSRSKSKSKAAIMSKPSSSSSSRSRSKSKSKSVSRSRSRSRSYSRSRSRSRSRSGGRSYSPEQGVRLHVGDLSSRATKQELEEVFEKYGKLVEVWMSKAIPCFAFVVFKNKEDAEKAVEEADGYKLHGKYIRVTYAKPRVSSFYKRNRTARDNQRCYLCNKPGHFSRDCGNSTYGYKRPDSRSPSRRSNWSSSSRSWGGSSRRSYNRY